MTAYSAPAGTDRGTVQDVLRGLPVGG